jgi:hypothetical protein
MTRIVDDKQVLFPVIFHDMVVNCMIQLKLWVSNVLKFRNRTTIVEALRKDVVQSFDLRNIVNIRKKLKINAYDFVPPCYGPENHRCSRAI